MRTGDRAPRQVGRFGRHQLLQFAFELPVVDQPAEDARTEAAPERSHARRVLVVEDNVDAAES